MALNWTFEESVGLRDVVKLKGRVVLRGPVNWKESFWPFLPVQVSSSAVSTLVRPAVDLRVVQQEVVVSEAEPLPL